MPDSPQSYARRSPRGKTRRRPRRLSQPAPTAVQAKTAQVAPIPKVTTPPAAPKETAPNYSYVSKDLKNIAIIMGSIVVVFIVLAFIWK